MDQFLEYLQVEGDSAIWLGVQHVEKVTCWKGWLSVRAKWVEYIETHGKMGSKKRLIDS